MICTHRTNISNISTTYFKHIRNELCILISKIDHQGQSQWGGGSTGFNPLQNFCQDRYKYAIKYHSNCSRFKNQSQSLSRFKFHTFTLASCCSLISSVIYCKMNAISKNSLEFIRFFQNGTF